MAKNSYPFPPAAMDENQAAFFCGNLDTSSFKKHIAPHVAAIKIGARKAYLTTSLQDYLNVLAGGASHDTGKPTNPLDNLL